MAGRHTKLTEDVLRELVGLVRAGTPIKTALQAKSIHESTAWRWLNNGRERPGSIYGAFRQELIAAQAEADVIDIQILTNAKTRTSKRTTTVTKRKPTKAGDSFVLDVSEQTTTEVELPPDPRWAWEMLKARNPAFRAATQVDMTVSEVPRDVMARTIAEKLRLVQGGEGPSLLADGDSEAARLMQGF